jgi:hypothetical protein
MVWCAHKPMFVSRCNRYTCEAYGESYYLHEDLVKHSVQVHGATLGEQLRQSDEIRKQRKRG